MNSELLKASATALKDCMGLKADESLLIVTDEKRLEIGQALFQAGLEMGVSPLLLQIPVGTYNGEEPPALAAELMKKVDVVVAPTTRSLTHTTARRDACAENSRVGTMPGITADIMGRTLSADYHKIADRTIKLTEILKSVQTVRIMASAGTDITIDVSTSRPIASTGIVDKPGSFGNLPSGEAYLAPVEGKTNGVFVVDASMAGIGKIEDKPITIEVKDGLAVNITGGKEARLLQEQIDAIGEKARNIAELGIGTNDQATITGNILEDEKVMGTVHIALGNNLSMGGTVNIPFHVDGIILKPTVWFDDKMIMNEGNLLI